MVKISNGKGSKRKRPFELGAFYPGGGIPWEQNRPIFEHRKHFKEQ